jgi:hypothetical protein
VLLIERAVVALEKLATVGTPDASAPTPEAPAKQTRTRKTPEAPQTPPPADDDGDFLDEPVAKEEPKYERADVKKALQDYGSKKGMDKAQKLLLDEGGVKALSDLPIEKFAAVINATKK